MQDFTLVIPTHNRPHLLAGLLGYLEAEAADFRVIVLDSSRQDVLPANCMRAARSNLDLAYIVIPNETPEQKWRKGLQAVTTSYCSLCGDDDLVIVDGIRRCLEALRSRPDAAVADGYSFAFQYQSDGTIELVRHIFFNPTIEGAAPLDRLARLFRQYQPPIYGVFRTPVLQRIHDMLEPLNETLARELLWSALTAVEGCMMRLPCLAYGRNMVAPAGWKHWHPLEWVCDDPDGFFAQYARYRGVLSAAVLQRPDNLHPSAEVESILDLIHLRYLLGQTPTAVLGFVADQEMNGVTFADYWRRSEIQLPLCRTSRIVAAQTATPRHVIVQRERRYILHQEFHTPAELDALRFEAVVPLLDSLDKYRRLPYGPSA